MQYRVINNNQKVLNPIVAWIIGQTILYKLSIQFEVFFSEELLRGCVLIIGYGSHILIILQISYDIFLASIQALKMALNLELMMKLSSWLLADNGSCWSYCSSILYIHRLLVLDFFVVVIYRFCTVSGCGLPTVGSAENKIAN